MTSKDWNRDGARRHEWRLERDEDLVRTVSLDGGSQWDPALAETITAPGGRRITAGHQYERDDDFDGAHYGRYRVTAAAADREERQAAAIPSARRPGHVGRRVLFAAAGLALVGGAGCTAARKLSSGSSGNASASGGSGPAVVPSQSRGQAVGSSPSPSASPSSAASSSAPPSGGGSPTDLASSSASNPVSTPPHTDGPSPSNPANPGQVPTQPQYYVEAGPKMIALTIDDGPSNIYTPQILALLDQYHIKATFCMIGGQVAANHSLVREVADAGHVIVNHTWSHPDMSKLSSAAVRSEISRANDALAAVGVHPSVFRAPYGAWSRAVFESCAAAGLRPLDWSVDPQDWSRPGTNVIVSRIMNSTRTGSIILEHDGGGDRSQTVAALKIVLPELLEAGYRFTGV